MFVSPNWYMNWHRYFDSTAWRIDFIVHLRTASDCRIRSTASFLQHRSKPHHRMFTLVTVHHSCRRSGKSISFKDINFHPERLQHRIPFLSEMFSISPVEPDIPWNPIDSGPLYSVVYWAASLSAHVQPSEWKSAMVVDNVIVWSYRLLPYRNLHRRKKQSLPQYANCRYKFHSNKFCSNMLNVVSKSIH